MSRAWTDSLKRLRAFKARFGHCRVFNAWSEDPRLAIWVGQQRWKFKNDLLPPDKKRQLEELGFDEHPEYICKPWKISFTILRDFFRRFRHCNVPRGWKENPALARWVANQRSFRTHGRLSEERIRLLDQVGFLWAEQYSRALQAGRDHVWEKNLKALKAFKKRFGHCRVPLAKDSILFHWVGTQRHQRRLGRLSADRIRQLDELGFVWNADRTMPWSSWFAKLQAFKARFGHCRVKIKWEEEPRLGGWVTLQRYYNRQGLLPADRKRMLDDLGFDWNPPRGGAAVKGRG